MASRSKLPKITEEHRASVPEGQVVQDDPLIVLLWIDKIESAAHYSDRTTVRNMRCTVVGNLVNPTNRETIVRPLAANSWAKRFACVCL